MDGKTLVPHDGDPSLTIGDATVVEGGDLVFSVTLSNPSSSDITVTLTPTGITADGSDFDETPVQVTIPAGSTGNTVTIPTNVDDVDEPDETLQLAVISVDAGTLTDFSDIGQGTIQDSIRSITVDATAICVNDAAYLEYEITPVGFTPAAGATIQWIGSDSSVVDTLTDQPLTRTRLLWPGAEVDSDGRGINWPGWDWNGDEWVSVPSVVRPTVSVSFNVNPTEVISLDYPPATADCATGPRSGFTPTGAPVPPGPGSTPNGGNNVHQVPTMSEYMLILMAMMMLGAVYRHRGALGV